MKTEDEMVDAAIDCLNTAFKADPGAIHAILCNRIPTNQALAEHLHVIVQASRMFDGHTLGFIGLLNGVLNAMGLPRIASCYVHDAEAGHYMLAGFCKYGEGAAPPQSVT